MSYGLQIFNAQGNTILDTDERFTRVYGSYPNNVIQGIFYNGTSNYLELATFTQDVVVSLPPGINKWVPVVVATNMEDTPSYVEGQYTADNILYYIGRGLSEGRLSEDMMFASGNVYPLITAEAVIVNGAHVARFAWRYCASLRGKLSDTTFTVNTQKKLTYTFVVVGY